MNLTLSQFHYFNPDIRAHITYRNLPHWEQRGVCAFVTMRLADSLPDDVLKHWVTERNAWLATQGIFVAEDNRERDDDGDDDDAHEETGSAGSRSWRLAVERLPTDLRREFHETFTRKMHDLLDVGHGECLLRRPDLRAKVAASFRHWHGERCLLAGWVIMPNHAHLLVQPTGDHGLKKLCRSWKQFTGRAINTALGRTGEFWQGESWDHLLRRAEYLVKYRKYLAQNPVKAGLRDDEYSLWLPEIKGLVE
jgi:putative transposase